MQVPIPIDIYSLAAKSRTLLSHLPYSSLSFISEKLSTALAKSPSTPNHCSTPTH